MNTSKVLLLSGLLIASVVHADPYGSYGSVPEVTAGQPYHLVIHQNYSPPSYGPNGYMSGSHGYNGITGRSNRRYIPVDPSLAPGVDRNGYAK